MKRSTLLIVTIVQFTKLSQTKPDGSSSLGEPSYCSSSKSDTRSISRLTTSATCKICHKITRNQNKIFKTPCHILTKPFKTIIYLDLTNDNQSKRFIILSWKELNFKKTRIFCGLLLKFRKCYTANINKEYLTKIVAEQFPFFKPTILLK